MTSGRTLGIYIAPTAGAPMEAVEAARCVPGKGLAGDRYFEGLGTFLKREGVMSSQEATLIEREAIEGLRREYGIELEFDQTRRNIVTSGIALNHLINQEFSIGEVRFKGIRLCEPCGHLEKMTQDGVRKGLIHRGGLRAQILTEGEIRIGDSIVVQSPTEQPTACAS